MVSNAAKKQKELNDERTRILQLIRLTKELRDLIIKHANMPGMTLSKLCTQAGAQSGTIYRFIKGKTVIAAGDTLENITTHLGRPDLATSIVKCGQGKQAKRIGMAKFSDVTVNIIYDIHDAHTAHALDTYSYKEFARVFGEDLQDVAYDVLEFKGEAAQKLEDDTQLRDRLKQQIDDPQFSAKIRTTLEHIQQERASAANRYYSVTRELLEHHYPDADTLAAGLGFHCSTHNNVLRGNVPVERIRHYTTIAQRHLNSLTNQNENDSEPMPTIKQASQAAILDAATNEEPNEKTQDVSDVVSEHASPLTLRQAGGNRSCLDVPFSMTPDGFTELDIDPSEQFVDCVRQQLELARAMLNACTQIKNERTRERIRASLETEVLEMRFSIDSFSDVYPNALLKVREAQRVFAEQVTFHKGEKP